MPRLTLRVGLAALALATVAGCQPPAAVPTPAPTPTFTCTPEAGGDAYECSQAQYDEMVAKNELYAEAEAVYRKFLAEDIRIMRAGGVMEPTPALLETTTGAFLEDVMSDYRQLRKDRTSASGDDPVLAWMKRAVGKSKGGSVVALSVCVDGTGLTFESRGRAIGTGQVAQDDVYFGETGERLVILGADGRRVASCG